MTSKGCNQRWWALAGEGEGEGWRTIPVEPGGSRKLLAGRCISRATRRPSWSASVRSMFHPLASSLREQGFRVDRVKHTISGQAQVWVSACSPTYWQPGHFSRMAEDILGMLGAYGHVDDQTLFQLFLGRIKAWQEFMHQSRAEG